jgi:hypothetical protein
LGPRKVWILRILMGIGRWRFGVNILVSYWN